MDSPTLTDDAPLEIAGRVHVDWYGLRPADPTPTVFAHLAVRDADSGEPLIAFTSLTIRCAADEYDGLARVELTELLDTDGSPLRIDRPWSKTDETTTSTYLLALREQPNTGDIGWALTQLRDGRTVTRKGWNGLGQWLVLVPGSRITVETGRPLGDAAPALVGREVAYRQHIDIMTVQGSIVPWVASQSDLLAEDWLLAAAPGASGRPA